MPNLSRSQDRAVVITGVTGFIGNRLAHRLREEGWIVIGVDKMPADHELLANLSSFHTLELPDPAFDRLLSSHSPQLCIHCAGTASVGQSMIDVAADFYGNTVLTFEVLNALRLNAPRCRFILLSSAAVYGNPTSLPIAETQTPAPISPYGFHKWQCELLCQEFFNVSGLPTAVVRVFSAYGPGLRRQVVWDICHKALNYKSVMLQGSGRESRDFVHILDIVRALQAVATSAPMHGEVYNIGTSRETTIAELAHIILDALGRHCSLEFDGVVPSGTPLKWRADISKVRALGFVPSVSLEEGMKAVARWCRSEMGSV